jgi:hypothetical protein
MTRNILQCQRGRGHTLVRRFLVLALVAIVTAQTAITAFAQEEAPPTPPAQQTSAPSDSRRSMVLQIRRGSFVEVRLMSGEQLRGRLGDILDEGFMIRTVSNNRLTDLQVRFADLSSVAPVSNPQTRGQAFDRNLRRTREIVGIVAIGAAVTLVAILVARAAH